MELETITFDPARYKLVPVEPTNRMMNEAVIAWQRWTSRDNGGNLQELGKLMWDHMVDCSPAAPTAPAAGDTSPE